MIYRPSYSHTWMVCALAQITPPTRPDTDNDAARQGTCAAWVSECVINGDATTAEDMLGKTHSNGWEVDLDMVRYVQEYIDVFQRREGAAPGQAEVFVKHANGLQGTADHVQWKPDLSMLWITDLKYGYGVVEARNNWQLLCYLYLVLSQVPHHQWPPMVQLAIYQPRAMHNDGPYRKWVLGINEYTPFLQAITDRIAAIHAGEDKAVPGRQCKHCQIADGCEALTRSVYNIADFVTESRSYRQPTGQQLADELIMLEQMSDLFEARKTAVEAEALARIHENQMVPGWSVEKRYGKAKFKVDPTFIQMTTGVDPYEQVLVTPAELKRRGAPVEVVEQITESPFIGTKLSRLDSEDIAARFAAAQKPRG